VNYIKIKNKLLIQKRHASQLLLMSKPSTILPSLTRDGGFKLTISYCLLKDVI